MGLVVRDKPVKQDDPSLKNSREIPPEAVETAFSTVFPYNFRPETDNDVIFGVAVDSIGMNVPIKLGDSR